MRKFFWVFDAFLELFQGEITTKQRFGIFKEVILGVFLLVFTPASLILVVGHTTSSDPAFVPLLPFFIFLSYMAAGYLYRWGREDRKIQ